MPSIRAELHTHSNYSDGALSPSELARALHAAGVSHWVLTDHDNCLGAKEAAESAAELGIEFSVGIEISAFDDRSIHVLGYNIDPVRMESYSVRRLGLREERMAEMIGKLNELGVPVTMAGVQAVAGQGAIGRPHLARAMVQVGAADSIPDAFHKYIGNDGPAYVESQWPSVAEAIKIIHCAGGHPVLAHPGLYARDDQIPRWASSGLVGIEVRHPNHDRRAVTRYSELADKLGVLKTASSDYHGGERKGPQLGETLVDQEVVEFLFREA